MLFRHVIAAVALAPSLALAANVSPRFDLNSPSGGPFPADVFTVRDDTQNTGLRMNLPKLDCPEPNPDCEVIDLINELKLVNELDGFQRSPEISIPFDGDIDPATVRSDTVFLVSLGSTLPGGEPAGEIIGIDVRIWDALAKTLHFQPETPLEEHARYAVVVTRDVRDRRGERIGRSEAFHHFAREGDRERDGRNPELDTYRRSLREALAVAERSGIEHSKIAVMSVFTTLSSSALFLKLRDHVGALPAPEPASFLLGPGGTRSVFAVPQITAMTFNRDVGTNPATGATILSSVSLASRIGAMRIVPGVLGRLAFGSLVAPRYDNEGSIARIPSRTGEVRQLGTRTLTFVLFLPSGPMPPGGWPTVLYGYGGADNKQNGPYLVAAAMAESGFATIAIDLPGNGFGERSTVTVATGARSTTVLAGGRSFDQNGDGVIAVNEGANAAPPRTLLLGTDRGIQGVTDVLHLIRVIEAGMDADGDGARDLDPSRIYAFGFSAGGGVMEIAMGLEPKIRAGVFNSAGIGGGDGLPFGPARPAAGAFIAARKPPLNNVPPAVGITEVGDGKPAPFGSICVNVPPLFNDTPVLPHRPTVVSAVPGAMVIREFLDRLQWVSQPGSSAGMLMHLRRRFPVTSVAPVLFQRSKGDQTALNFAGLDVLRAAGFEDRITWLRYSDKVFDGKLQANPHNISQRTDSPDAATRALALALQRQAAQFLASDGTFVPDPDGAAPVFEFPISDPDAYGLNYVPAPCPPGT